MARLKNPVRISRLPPRAVKWIMARARTFLRDSRGERPAWTYIRIARNFQIATKISLSRFSVRRLVTKMNPELARRRRGR